MARARKAPPPGIQIHDVTPQVNCGRFPVKRVLGEDVVVNATIFRAGHDVLGAAVRYRPPGARRWREALLEPLGNDRWRGSFTADAPGRWTFTVTAWVDRIASWQDEVTRKLDGGQTELEGELSEGRALLGADVSLEAALAAPSADRHDQVELDVGLGVDVDPPLARFGSWYELFPRSFGGFAGVERVLPQLSGLGFDVVYLPPIHPIGHTNRKGRNNAVTAKRGDVGSPWAIGAEEGGHTAIHPDLGTLDDFERLVVRARELGIEIALDYAIQCSPDHPWLKEHPEWFHRRPDGTLKYAENPPKKYQDIYPLDFETSQWQALWEELKSIFFFWIEQGVRIFRVDNPHTKSFPFWEWVIAEIKKQYPEVLFLAEAFTRPNVMYRLAKLGFSQSYTYFTWRNTKHELTEYFTELTQTDVREYFRPNLWPNTPDILPEFLQVGGRPAFMVRLILAATLGASYGIYGPAFELCENTPLRPGSEEYLDSEKYELKHRDLNSRGSLKSLISRLNRIRKENRALQSNDNLRFHETDNPALICYSKATDDLSSVIIVVVNLDCFHVQTGWLDLDLSSIGLDTRHAFQAHDLLSEGRFLWQGSRNYVELTPENLPAHILRLRRWVRTERDFDYYL